MELQEKYNELSDKMDELYDNIDHESDEWINLCAEFVTIENALIDKADAERPDDYICIQQGRQYYKRENGVIETNLTKKNAKNFFIGMIGDGFVTKEQVMEMVDSIEL
ncbi:MAG: hypothetical protein DRH57_08810 [Candidatus Cloacimonadota bacterium]|nr:MAG: hypothetical protein DRH57_08810 [Candidatus Cloacimonadota bacterium]